MKKTLLALSAAGLAAVANAAPLKFLTFNIWGDYFKNPVAERMGGVEAAILKDAPDVVALQEVTPNWWECGMFERLVAAGYGVVRGDEAEALRRAGLKEMKRNCVNHEPLVYRKETLSLVASGLDFFHVILGPEKSLTWAVFEERQSSRRFAAFATHFWWQANGKESDALRELNARQLLWRLAAIRRKWGAMPAIMGGDLNSIEASAAHATLRQGGFMNAASSADVRSPHRSHHGNPVRGEDGRYHGAPRQPADDRPELSIDYIYYTRGIHALRHDISLEQAVLDVSDHSPVLVEFEVED